MEEGHLLSELYLIFFHPKDFCFVYLPCLLVPGGKKNGETLLLASSQKSQKVDWEQPACIYHNEICHEGHKVYSYSLVR